MTLQEFKATERIITDQLEIAEWLETVSVYDYDGKLISLHVYEESYYIEERRPGFFGMIIENTEPEGTLAECEKILWDWVYGPETE